MSKLLAVDKSDTRAIYTLSGFCVKTSTRNSNYNWNILLACICEFVFYNSHISNFFIFFLFIFFLSKEKAKCLGNAETIRYSKKNPVHARRF